GDDGAHGETLACPHTWEDRLHRSALSWRPISLWRCISEGSLSEPTRIAAWGRLRRGPRVSQPDPERGNLRFRQQRFRTPTPCTIVRARHDTTTPRQGDHWGERPTSPRP